MLKIIPAAQRELVRDLACKVGVAYLSAPVFLFFGTWFKPIFAISLATLLAYGLRGISALHMGHLRAVAHEKWIIVLCVVVAFLLLLVCGGSPVVDSIWSLDLQKHLSIENDLISRPWPVSYFSKDGTTSILRYSLGYYLVPTAIAKLVQAKTAEWLVYLWSSVGVSIFLVIATSVAKSRAWAIVFILVTVFWGGLSTVGLTLSNQFTLTTAAAGWMYGRHAWLIGSNIFSAALSPQHAIAGWLLGATICLCRDEKWLRQTSGMCVVVAMFWSPFVALVLIALFAVTLLVDIRSKGIHDLKHPKFIFPPLVTGSVLLLYLGADASTIRSTIEIPTSFSDYMLFTFIEFLLVALATIWAARKTTLLVVLCVSILSALPFYLIGAGDLLMRGSILPTTILCIYASLAIQNGRGIARYALIFLVSGSMVCSGLELWRQATTPRTAAVIAPIFMFRSPIWPQYVAAVPDKTLLAGILRKADTAFTIQPSPIGTSSRSLDMEGEWDTRPKSQTGHESYDALVRRPMHLAPGIYRVSMDVSALADQILPPKLCTIEVSIEGQSDLIATDRWHWGILRQVGGAEDRYHVDTFFKIGGDVASDQMLRLKGWCVEGAGKIGLSKLSLWSVSPKS